MKKIPKNDGVRQPRMTQEEWRKHQIKAISDSEKAKEAMSTMGKQLIEALLHERRRHS